MLLLSEELEQPSSLLLDVDVASRAVIKIMSSDNDEAGDMLKMTSCAFPAAS